MSKRDYLCNLYDWWELFWPALATWADLRSAANADSAGE